MNLSPNFTFAELTFSQVALRTGIPNVPSADEDSNLARLCLSILEPARALLGVPLHVDSGYRSLRVNELVGGAPTSAHMEGRAADVVPIGMPLIEAFDRLRASDIHFDQIILECGSWIHLAIAPEGMEPRREALLASGGPGHWSYLNA